MLRLDNHPKTKYRALSRANKKLHVQPVDAANVKNLLKNGSTDSILDKEGLLALENAARNVE